MTKCTVKGNNVFNFYASLTRLSKLEKKIMNFRVIKYADEVNYFFVF